MTLLTQTQIHFRQNQAAADRRSHFVKRVHIWSFSLIRTEYGPEKTPNIDIFHAVSIPN